MGKKKIATKKEEAVEYKTDITVCGDTQEIGLVIWLSTTEQKVADKRADEIVKVFNRRRK